jgi:hypothetical protein
MKAVLLAAFLLVPGAAFAAGSITSYQTKGNLAVTHDLACIPLAEAKNDDTPPDLMRGLAKCVEAARYDEALEMFLLAGVYARFDTTRVADVSAHDAFQVIVAQTFGSFSEDEGAKLRATMQRYKATGSPEFARACAAIRKLGPPDYRPDYMTSHGMGAFVGGSTDAPAKFDAGDAWKKSIDSYLHCP